MRTTAMGVQKEKEHRVVLLFLILRSVTLLENRFQEKVYL